MKILYVKACTKAAYFLDGVSMTRVYIALEKVDQTDDNSFCDIQRGHSFPNTACDGLIQWTLFDGTKVQTFFIVFIAGLPI